MGRSKLAGLGADVDSGYAWVIVFASFALHMQQVAPISTLGIFLVEFADYFTVSKASLGWIGAFQLSTGYLLGVIIGPISRKVGCRPVVWLGSLLMSLGYLVSFFSPNVKFLYFTFGLLTGIGIGCLFTPATIVVQLYFHHKRAFAASIAISGTAVGVFFWPPFVRWMIDVFAWRGALIVMSAMQLHGLIFGSLLRPRPSVFPESDSSHDEDDLEDAMFELPDITNSKSNWTADPESLSRNISSRSCSCVDPESRSRILETRSQSQSLSHGASTQSNVNKSLESLKCSHISEDFTTVRQPELISTKHQIFWKYLPWVLFFFGNWLVQSCHVLITVLTPVRAHWFGIENHLAAFLISLYGVTSGVCRSCMGWLGDRKEVNRLVLFGVSAMLAGAFTCISAFFRVFWLLAIYSSVFGVLAAAYIGLLGAVVVSVFSMEHIAIGTGVMSMTVGFANLVTHPLAGWLLDQEGGYTLVFIVFGLVQVSGGLCILAIALIHKFKSQTH